MELILTGRIDVGRRGRGARAGHHGRARRRRPSTPRSSSPAGSPRCRRSRSGPRWRRSATPSERPLADGLAREREAFFRLFDTDDQAEGHGRLHREALAGLDGSLTAAAREERTMERDLPGGSDVGRDLERDLGDAPPAAIRDTRARLPGPIDAVGPGQRPRRARRVDARRADSPEHDWELARTLIYPAFRPVGTLGLAIESHRPASRSPPTRTQSHAQPLLDEGPAGLPVVYTIDAGGFDIVVNGDHLLSWGVEPREIQDAAMRNLAAWSATAAVDDEVSGEPAPDQLADRRRARRRPDPAARGRRAPRRRARVVRPDPRRDPGTPSADRRLAAPGRRRLRGPVRRASSSSIPAAPTSRSTGGSSSSWTAGWSNSTGRPPAA